ncbi:hypothetical protein DXG03_004622 [Asterophora parasitica]|uniref:Uncharacterized protein n=1 Tax=Asterophora parasitica TaxID=117018 RepID=A0A9P7KEL5_9AGAR|nr:hypothetical protein DXG03_004622 [Asterophora parasitica]
MDTSIPQVSVTPIDFAQTPLAGSYSAFYAKVIDGLFTPADCARLLSLASTGGGWQPAGLSTRNGAQTVHADFRNSDRVLVIDDAHATWIYEKLGPYVEEIHEIAPEGRWGSLTGRPGKKQGPTWSLSGSPSLGDKAGYREHEPTSQHSMKG